MPTSLRVLILSALPALLCSFSASAQQAAVPAPAQQTTVPAAAQAASANPAPAAKKPDPIAKLKQELGAIDSDKGLIIHLSGDAVFDFNQTGVRMESAPTLQKLSDLLRLLRKPVQLTGHTDNKGNAEYNKQLSQLRAKALKAALVQRGIRAGSIQTAGYGQERPKAANANPDGSDNPKGRDTNRRVEVLIAKR